MTLSDSDWLNQQYLSKFGRTADTTSAGGAKYWLDQMAANPTSHSRLEVARMLGDSAEGTAYNDPNSATYGVVSPGGVNRSSSTYGQADNEYLQSIRNLGLNNANVLNTIAGNSYLANADGTAGTDNVAGGYFQISDDELLNMGGGGGGATQPVQPADGWWSQFADADAFKDFLFGGQQDDGMGDFMKFMMLMSIMRPQGGGMGGGYGGSQYGYGGLNPGGVQAAYDPMQHLTGMGDWFKTNFGSGSGSGATTSTVNT